MTGGDPSGNVSGDHSDGAPAPPREGVSGAVWTLEVRTHRADAWPWRCGVCGAPHECWQRQCASCRAYDTVRRRGQTDESARSRAVRDTPNDDTPPVQLRGLGWLNDFLGGGLPNRCCWLLAGAPGGGKSSLAMQVCGAWPSAAPPLWISNEQPNGRVASYARRLCARDDLIVYGSETEITTPRAVARLAVEHRARLVVVDSVTGLEAGSVAWLNRWAYRRNVSVILVSQVNSEGDASGGPKPRHDASMVARLARIGDDDASTRRLFTLDKSQHGGNDGAKLELVKTTTGALAPA